jgi:hypothetical protein
MWERSAVEEEPGWLFVALRRRLCGQRQPGNANELNHMTAITKLTFCLKSEPCAQ